MAARTRVMAIDESSENGRAGADERAVRRFLENAAPVILESRVLDGERFEAVIKLADELGLNRDQLACELRLLEQRGVITSAPWERFDDIAPLPEASDPTAPTTPATPAPSSPVDAAAGVSADAQPQIVSPGEVAHHKLPVPGGASKSPPPPPASAQRAARTREPSPASPLDALRSRASKLIAKHGSLGAKTLRKLHTAGQQAGLTPAEIAAVLNGLQPRDTAIAPPVAAPAPAVSDAKRPSAPSPSESFRRWIKQKLAGYPSSLLGTDDERGLIGVGIHRYHLAEVLATHIVRDVSTDQGIRLERDLADASCHSTVGASTQASSDDQRLKEFFEQVAPILSQHRGINAKSRVMMNAVAERLGLSESELEQALLALQRLAGDPNENDPRQLERRESFRTYLRRAMAQLPDGIITYKTETRLMEAGEHFHGVTPQWIRPTILEVASEIGVRFISRQQALEHVSALVEDFLGDKPTIDSTTRARIYTEGIRWGLDPMDVESILRDKTEALRRQAAMQRRRARWVLNLVVAGALIAISVLAWILLPQITTSEPSPADDGVAVAEKTPETKRPAGPSWWDADVRIAIANLRIIRPDLRTVLAQIASDQMGERQAAYRQLTSQFAHALPNQKRQEEMQQLLAALYALEPSDLAAEELAEAVADQIGTLDTELPPEPETVRAMFWGCRAAVDMLKHPTTPIQRSAKLAQLLEAATLESPDRLLDAKALQRRCSGALARRLYQHLSRSAAEDPDLANRLYAPLSSEAGKCLDSATLDRLDVDFLAAILPELEDTWDRYAEVIHRVALAADPTTVIKMLDIYRRVSNPRLKNYVAGQFLERLAAAPGSLTEQEMVDGIRKSLGVASKDNDNRRWRLLAASAEELLGRKRVARTNPDVLLQETIELAHATTLACALAQGEAGGPQFDELQAKGAVKLDIRSGPWDTARPKMFDSPYPVTGRTVLRNSIHSLATSRLAAQRTELLRMIANQTASVPDLDLPSGLSLAAYLVQFKPDEQEHLQMLRYAPQVANWHAVRLGLADQLLDVPGRDTQLEQLFAAILAGEVELNTEAGRARIRRQLLTQVSAGLAAKPDTDDPRLRVFDEGSAALRDLYATQARIMSIPPDDYSTAGSPSDVMAALIRYLGGLLSTAKLEAADRALVDELPYRLKAVDFVAANDLQYTVALQQIWLQLVALHVSQQQPTKAGAVREIQAESGKPVPDGENVFEQLRNQQISLLRVWLLLRPPTDETELADADG